MLKLRKTRPAHVPVKLGGDAIIRVRPAIQADVELAGARAQRVLLGLVQGSEAGMAMATVLGEGFDISALADDAKISAAGVRLASIYLVMVCHDGWSGIADEDGNLIEKPDEFSVALLLEDSVCYAKVMAVINQAIHEETSEKNVSAASPSGGAGIRAGAETAAAVAIPAPSVDPSPTSTPESQSAAPN
jgi:hypothetical protein